MSRTVDNLTVREKLVSNEIQSIFNSSVNQRCTNIQADNISCNTISYVNGPAGGGGEITSTNINTNTYNINSIDYTYYFLTYDDAEPVIQINLNNLNISQLGKIFYIFYRNPRPLTKAILFICDTGSFIIYNRQYEDSITGLSYLTNKWVKETIYTVPANNGGYNTLIKITPVIYSSLTYFYLDEYVEYTP